MTAVTQIIPNYLGGVSRQPDEKKSPGQVADILNGYPDPTNGLTKRNGLEFVSTLDTDLTGLEDAAWFFINRDNFELYFGCITTEGKFRIWDVLNRTEVPESNIIYDGKSAEYLKAGLTYNDYKFLTVQDVVFVVNKTEEVKQNYGQDSAYNYLEHPLPFKTDNVATVKIQNVSYNTDYEIFIKSDFFSVAPIKYKTPQQPTIGSQPKLLTASDVLQGLADQFPKELFDVTVLNTCLEIASKEFDGGIIDDSGDLKLYSDKEARLYFTVEPDNEPIYLIQNDEPLKFTIDEYTIRSIVTTSDGIKLAYTSSIRNDQGVLENKLRVYDVDSEGVVGTTFVLYQLDDDWNKPDPPQPTPPEVLEYWEQEDIFDCDFDEDKWIGNPADQNAVVIEWSFRLSNSRDNMDLYENQYGDLGLRTGEFPDVQAVKRYYTSQPVPFQTPGGLGAAGIGAKSDDNGNLSGCYIAFSSVTGFSEGLFSLTGGTQISYPTNSGTFGDPEFEENLWTAEDHCYVDLNKDGFIGNPENGVAAPALPPVNEFRGTPFNIEVKSGVDGTGLDAYQSEVENSARLSANSIEGRRVKVLNTDDDKSSYFVTFIANQPSNPIAGNGYWEEDLGWEEYDGNPDVTPYNALASFGVQITTMPHVLKIPEPGKFEFSTYPYVDRLVGSEVSNPSPTYVDQKINNIFLDNNRLGFLAGENVILSQSGEFGNFYFTSAKTITEADPIDLNCSSIRPAKLHTALPVTQGLVIFSKFEQFMLFSESGTLTPSDSVIRSISKYETDPLISPVDVGTSMMFVSKTPSSTRTMGMVTRGLSDNPTVVDISKIVSDYIPNDIDLLTASPQNSFIAMSSKDKNDIYFYRFFNNGEKDVMQAWFRWKVPGQVQSHIIANDTLFLIVRNEGGYQLLQSPLSQSTLIQDKVNLRFDHYFACNDSKIEDQPFVYDSLKDRTKLPSPYSIPSTGNYISYLTSEVIVEDTVYSIEGASNRLHYVNSGNDYVGGGYISELIIEGGEWFIAGDWTGTDEAGIPWRNRMLIGELYDFEVELPDTYFRIAEVVSDFTASLTLARYRFSLGESGQVNFLSKAKGSDEWIMASAMSSANYYNADTPAATNQTLLTVPIYQRNNNFSFKIQADTPLPVSINSMMWEGKYVPRNYRRA